jgi:hypothetical protein
VRILLSLWEKVAKTPLASSRMRGVPSPDARFARATLSRKGRGENAGQARPYQQGLPHHHLGADADAAIEIDDIVVEHADAAR